MLLDIEYTVTLLQLNPGDEKNIFLGVLVKGILV